MRLWGKICAVLAAFVITGCAAPGVSIDMASMKPVGAVSKSDQAACAKLAERAVNNPERRQSQTSTLAGASGSGFVGALVVSLVQSADDSSVNDAAMTQCLAKRGYTMKPAS
jgi:hypothetical protein